MFRTQKRIGANEPVPGLVNQFTSVAIATPPFPMEKKEIVHNLITSIRRRLYIV